ncbi:hypothetical protein BAY60_01330 [Prauserella muralis]|uniref:DUF4878 domain-containing protein n=1 Tax=Prauserella muralis TaxID=588067 RepID=A0A2V4BBJ6_9PSEU|nr:hypothetical protein BAY60_01330 [Prauserella muralis]
MLIGVVAIIVTWLVVVTVLIAREPEIGVESPQRLRAQLEHALNERDAEQLTGVLGYPPGHVEDFAGAYVARLDDTGAHAIEVTLEPGTAAPRVAKVSGRLAGGGTFAYRVAVAERDGSWRLEFTPPL